MDNIKVVASREDIVAIADAIREKTGTTEGMTYTEMVEAIGTIDTKLPEQSKTVTAGVEVVTVTPDAGYVLNKVEVNPTPSQTKTVTAGISVTTVTPDNGKLLSSVTVNPTPSEEKTVTAKTSQINVTPASGKLLSKVTVDPTPSQSKTVAPTKEVQIVEPDDGYLLSSVTVDAAASGDIVNGLIESYLAVTETIDANTFVEFVGSGGLENVGSMNVSNKTIHGNITATLLSDTKVLIVQGVYTTAYYIYAYLVTIDDTSLTITASDISVKNVRTNQTYHDVVVLTENKVLLFYSEYDTSGYHYATVLTINEASISVGSTKQIAVAKYSALMPVLIKLSETKVFVSYIKGDDELRYAQILTINGTSVSTGTATAITTDTYNGYAAGKLIDDSRILLTFYRNQSLRAVIVSINNTTITLGTTVIVGSNYSNSYAGSDIIMLSNNEVFVMYSVDSSKRHIYGAIIDINGTELTIRTKNIVVIGNDNAGYAFRSVKLSSNLIAVICCNTDKNKLYGYIVEVGSDVIIKEETCIVDSTYDGSFDVEQLSDGRLILAHQGPTADFTKGYTTLVELSEKRISKSVAKIEGITKTECTTEAPGEVWVLNPNA